MLRVMRVCVAVCGVRGAVSRVRRVLTGVGVTDVACVSAVRTVTSVRAMTTVSNVPKLGEPSHRHRGESSAAESEAEAIEIHMPNTTCWRLGW
jgi:hypothetical protein